MTEKSRSQSDEPCPVSDNAGLRRVDSVLEKAFLVHGTAVEYRNIVSGLAFMKPILTFLLLVTSFIAMAQSSSSLNTVINEDDKTMSIQVNGERNGKTINYQRTFDVTNLTSTEKDELKTRVLDSLGVGKVTTAPDPEPIARRGQGAARSSKVIKSTTITSDNNPRPSAQPTPSAEAGQVVTTFTCETCSGKIKLEIVGKLDDYSIERDAKAGTDKRLFPYQIPLTPGDYTLNYYQNGVLQIQSAFTVKLGESGTVVIN